MSRLYEIGGCVSALASCAIANALRQAIRIVAEKFVTEAQIAVNRGTSGRFTTAGWLSEAPGEIYNGG